jgi:hypothetical protein
MATTALTGLVPQSIVSTLAPEQACQNGIEVAYDDH